ncbi:MAG TPA: hypothetical protein VGZ22_26605 [Isosphaeraceae bacterium]|jgi:hypothetical protein|nr:hypothetical protein [Isosphaeraceae bacterium]
MDLYERLFSRDEDVPEWARFMKAKPLRTLLGIMSSDLDRRGMRHVVDVAGGVIRFTDQESEARSLGLLNLLQICNHIPESEWPAIVSEHFDRMLRATNEGGPLLSRLADDFEQARELLKVRLFSADIAGREFIVAHEPMDDVLAVLVYDLPDSVATVHRDHVAAWGRPVEELFEIALANVKASDPVEAQTFAMDEGGALTLLGSPSHFAAAHALFLGDYLTPEHSLGAVVAIPHRHAVVFHPIVDATVVPAISAMIRIAQGMYQEGPGSISLNLYWWHDGEFLLLPCQVTDKEISFSPPDAFIDVLNQVMS